VTVEEGWAHKKVGLLREQVGAIGRESELGNDNSGP